MLKTRIIPTVLLKESVLVQTVRFSVYRPIGVPRQAVRVYNMREVDEMVILDIDARLGGEGPRFNLLRDLAEECFMPLAVGGGIRNIDEIRRLLKDVADKVVINTEAVERPWFIEESAGLFGSQCIVASIDAKRRGPGMYEVYTYGGKKPTSIDAVWWAREVEARGAGEILLTSVDRDGTMEGYDLDLIRSVVTAVSIPVIASGGAGQPEDFVDAVVQGGASAVAAGSVFQFTQVTPNSVKSHLSQTGIQVRVSEPSGPSVPTSNPFRLASVLFD